MQKLKAVFCALFGHSRIVNTFWGEVTCGRCKVVVGDTLAGIYSMLDKVILGHDCETCRKNFKALNWKDKLFTPNPFTRSNTEAVTESGEK